MSSTAMIFCEFVTKILVNIVTIPWGTGRGVGRERKPVVSIQSRFDTNSSRKIIVQKFLQFKYSLRVNKKNVLGEYSSF